MDELIEIGLGADALIQAAEASAFMGQTADAYGASSAQLGLPDGWATSSPNGTARGRLAALGG